MTESILMTFMRARQRECGTPLDVVSVKWIGGGKLNQCFDNAHRMIRDDEIDITSGWLALPPDRGRNRRQFTQHWWNYSRPLGQFIDTSPDIEDGAIYIWDADIALFAATNNHRLTSCVPRSVVFRDGRFFCLEQFDNRFQLEPIRELTTEFLFEPYLVDVARLRH